MRKFFIILYTYINLREKRARQCLRILKVTREADVCLTLFLINIVRLYTYISKRPITHEGSFETLTDSGDYFGYCSRLYSPVFERTVTADNK